MKTQEHMILSCLHTRPAERRKQAERDCCVHMDHIFQVAWKNYSVLFENAAHTHTLTRSKGISWCVFAIDSHCCLRFLPSLSGQQTVKCMPSCCCQCWLYCLSQFRASSERLSSMDHNEKPHGSTKSKRDSIYWNPCRDSISLAYRRWVWFSQCYPYVTPTLLHPRMLSFSSPQNRSYPPPSRPPPPPLPLHLLLWTAGSQCVFLFIPRFSPALTTPSLHPFLSCVLCCQAQLDQACQSSHMQSLLVWKQAAQNYWS